MSEKPKLKKERLKLVEDAIKTTRNELVKERLEKLKQLLEKNIEPFPYSYKIDIYSNDILSKYDYLKKSEESRDFFNLAGRIYSVRRMGKLTFIHILDAQGKIQLLFRFNLLKKKYKLLKKIDIGDFIGVYGNVFKTKAGEITIDVNDFCILSKALRPLPEKWHGLKNVELVYRKRYLDLIMNEDSKKRFITRSKIIKAIREFLDSRGFIEVETPVLQPIYGGANARPFITHHHDLDIDIYLRISNELYLKRLIIGGFDKVYEIVKDFRNESIDRTHNPEFTQIEFYQAYADYNDIMNLCEELYIYVARKILGKTKFRYLDHEINLKKPWKRITMIDSLKEYAGIDIDSLDDEDIKKLLKKYNITLEDDYSRGLSIEKLFNEVVEKKLIQPVFIIDHPKETTPLCKWHRSDERLVERVEPYIAGMEIANGYSELNDPLIQKKLFEKQSDRKKAGEEETHPLDMEFVEALEYGMPPTGGLGIGVDRMVMLFTNAASIRDVILFPTLRLKKN